MPRCLELKRHDPSGTIILNRPDCRNAMSREMVAELQEALGDFHQQRQVRAVILTGAGEAFCSGLDLAEMRDTRQSSDPLERWFDDMVQYRELLQTMLQFPKPIIAAVNGAAAGAGAALVLASDLVVGSSASRVGLPEPRLGIVSGLAAPLLAFRLGASAAARLLLTGQLAEADEALRLGLLHELVDDDMVWARAHALAEQCALCAPEALQLTKQLLNETIGEHLSTALSAGAAASATARTTEAAAEGISAFFEKREPRWL
jgi:enoyl-CoA hydratase/carnithine racemase